MGAVGYRQDGIDLALPNNLAKIGREVAFGRLRVW
jgi:hypothetical protein